MANKTIETSKAVMIGIIILLLILLLMFVPGLRDFFTKGTSKSGGTTPVNVKVNGQTVPTSGSSTTTKSGSGQATGTDSAVNVDVNGTKDGTTINIKIPDQVNVDANGTTSSSASVSPLPGL